MGRFGEKILRASIDHDTVAAGMAMPRRHDRQPGLV